MNNRTWIVALLLGLVMIGSASALQNSNTMPVKITVAKWYPKYTASGTEFVFVCETPGWTPKSYSWSFNDGEKLINVQNRDVFHRYTTHGQYMVTCTAQDYVSKSGTGKFLAIA